MLQAYNPAWAFRVRLRAHAGRWHHRQLLNIGQLAAIEATYPLDFYRPAWPLRVALFVLSCFGIATATMFVVASVSGSYYSANSVSSNATFLITATATLAGCFALLEIIIRSKQLYRAGPDNALLYSGLLALASLIFFIFTTYFHLQDAPDLSLAWLLPLLLTQAVLLAATVRYADILVALFAILNVLGIVFLVACQSAWGLIFLPFLVMGFAVALGLLHRYLARRLAPTPLADYYASCLLTLKVSALLLFYLAGNYFVVREANAELHHLYASEQVPFAPIFYAFTAGIPLLYLGLGLGLRRPDRPMLLLGFLTLALSIATLRYYRALLPPEVAATLAGIFLTALAILGLRGLRPTRFGLTSEPDDEPRHFNLENLIQAQTAHVPGSPAAGFEFGGGESGGGGATGQF